MDVNHLIGDAFQADKNSSSQAGARGQRITDAASYLSPDDAAISPKCNSVSFFKPESRPRECRNGVAVSDRYICYIVKGTMLRVIDTVTADKTLLKGHKSFITDIVFSGVDGDALCSVDMGKDGDGVFFWRLSSSEGALSSQLTGRFAVSACMARPHPVLVDVWVISDGVQLAVLSERQPSDTIKGYGDLHMNKLFPEGVKGAEFCSDGLQLIVTAGEGAHSSVYILKLPDVSSMASLHDRKMDLSQVFHIPMAHLQSAGFLHSPGMDQELVVTAQLVLEQSNQMLLSVWSQENFHDKPLTLKQSVNVSFPLIGSSNSDGYHSDMIMDPSKKRGFVLLSHRSSSFVCVLSVRQDRSRLVLYHASFLDLGKPILCMIPAVVQGEDTESGSSSPFGQDSHPMLQHLELTCLQDTMNMQHAIQQFHLSLASVIPIPHAEETPLVTSEPAVLSKVESINPFDALAPTASTTPKPASSSINSLMNLLKGGGAATPVVDAHPLKSPAADNFPYFALQKQESMEPPAAAAEPPAASDAFRSDTSSGFSAPVSSPPLPASTESRQQGLRIIDFLKSNAPAGVTEIIPPVDSALEVNPFDEASAVEIVPAALTGKKSGKDKKKSAIAETIAVAPTVAAPISLIDMESSVPHSMLGQIQSIVSSECRNAVEDVLRKDGWKDEMCVQISNDLKAELTMAIAEAVREGIKEQLKESVKTFLGKSFKTAFETTLVPAFQVGTAVLHTKLEGNYEQASRAISELNLHESNVILKLDHMQTELATLRASVSSLTAEVTSLREQQAKQGYTMAAAGKVDYETDPLVLLGQGRLADAVECALECHDISILLQVLKGSSTDAVLGCCNKLVVVCVIQQLAFDFSNNDPEEGVPARLDWLKELVMAVVSGDVERKMSVDGDAQLVGESKVQKACSTILQGVFDCLKKVELRIAPTGSIRTDLRMLCSLVKSVE